MVETRENLIILLIGEVELVEVLFLLKKAMEKVAGVVLKMKQLKLSIFPLQ